MIERLTLSHTDAFRSLRLEALRLYPDFYGTAYGDAVSTTLSTYARRIESGLLLGAFDRDGLIGCLAFDRDEGEKLEHRAWITSVFVQPRVQRLGVATRLMAMALSDPEADGITQVELFVSEANQTGRAFYERLGFHVVGRSPRALRVNGQYLDELHMVRFLDS
jgi:Acetyltransferases